MGLSHNYNGAAHEHDTHHTSLAPSSPTPPPTQAKKYFLVLMTGAYTCDMCSLFTLLCVTCAPPSHSQPLIDSPTGRPTALPRAIGDDALSHASGTVGKPRARAPCSCACNPSFVCCRFQALAGARVKTAGSTRRVQVAAHRRGSGSCTRRSGQERRARRT